MVPEEAEGLGLGVLDAAVLSRCLGAGVAPGPWLPTVVAGEALRLGGSDVPEAAKWLERIASGEVKVAFAPDLSLPVEYAAVADALVAVQDGKLALFEPDAYTVTPVAVLDRTTRLGTRRGDRRGSRARLALPSLRCWPERPCSPRPTSPGSPARR